MLIYYNLQISSNSLYMPQTSTHFRTSWRLVLNTFEINDLSAMFLITP